MVPKNIFLLINLNHVWKIRATICIIFDDPPSHSNVYAFEVITSMTHCYLIDNEQFFSNMLSLFSAFAEKKDPEITGMW